LKPHSPDLQATIPSFSSNPSPLVYFTEKKRQDAVDRGEFVDIHDRKKEHFDVLISDISEIVGIPYHSKASDIDARKTIEIDEATLFGRNYRIIFPCVVSREAKAHWVFFLVNTGSPTTYLSAQTGKLLGEKIEAPQRVNIAGHSHSIELTPKGSHFSDLNLLGNDFLCQHKVTVFPGNEEGKVKLYFGETWAFRKPKL